MIRRLLSKLYRPKVRFVFGKGEVLIQTGSYHGKPILILTHPQNTGKPGEDASGKERSAQFTDVMRRSVMLEFQSESHRNAVERVMLSRDV